MRCTAVLLTLLIMPCVGVDSAAQDSNSDRLHFFGDFRGRVELDRSSQRSDGSFRDDRDRLRIRGRFGMAYQRNEHLQLGWRLRTGDPASRQSPHITLGDEFKTAPLSLDRLYARMTFEKASVWFGKNSNPFWHQNELFWDDDVSLDGVAGSVRVYKAEATAVEGRAGLFILDRPQSNTLFDQSRMVTGQVIVSGSRDNLNFVAAISLSGIRENRDAEDERLSDLDYTFLTGGVSATYSDLSWPIRVGVDVTRNTEDYRESLDNRDERTAYVVSAQAGSLSESGKVLVRYTYAHIEKYAVVGPFAQDDWLRWGSSTITQSSNFSGHELRVAYVLGSGQNLTARLYRIEGVELESPSATTRQTGTRFRVDWNVEF